MAPRGGKKIVIVKKKVAGHGGHHGGSWKVAYADFVTAMMAFFLLMWLLGSTSEGDKKGIADYFASPLKIFIAGLKLQAMGVHIRDYLGITSTLFAQRRNFANAVFESYLRMSKFLCRSFALLFHTLE